MKIHQIQPGTPTRTANHTKLDLDQFTTELRILSERYDVKLLSVGAFSSADATSPTFMAIWSNEPAEAEPSEN